MFRKAFILTPIVFVFMAYEVQARSIIPHTPTWDGGGDGHSWEDPLNWDPDIVPDNYIDAVGNSHHFHVTFFSGAQATVTLERERTIETLDCYGAVSLKPWLLYTHWPHLTVENGLTNHGHLDLELHIQGSVNNLGDLEIGRGNFEIERVEIVGNITNIAGAELGLDNTVIEGNLYNESNATIGVGYEVDVEQGGLENGGLIEIFPGGEIYVNPYFNNIGEILIYGGECGVDEGVLYNTGFIRGFGVIYAEPSFLNKGMIYANGGALTIGTEAPISNTGTIGCAPASSLAIMVLDVPADDTSNSGIDANNFGEIDVKAGGSVAFNCSLINQSSAEIKLADATLAATTITQAADANFSGFGTISGNVDLQPNALISITGPTNLVGDVEINENATLEISDGLTLITGHTTCNGTIHMKGGRIIPQGGLSGDCDIIWEPGLYNNIADFNLDGQVNFEDFTDFADTWLWQAAYY